MGEPVYDIRALNFRYVPSRPILTDVDFTLDEGDFVGLLGPNGSGKSTFLALLTRRLRPVSGTVSYRGRDLAGWEARALAREIAVVPQREEVSFPFTAREIVLMGRYPHIGGFLGFESREDHALAEEALDRVDMRAFAGEPLTHLSGGERQLVLVARALAQQPRVLLLDEPTSSLDLCHKQMIYELLEELNRERGVTIVTVSHDLNLAGLYCREIALLYGNRFSVRGRPAEVIEEERLRQVYQARLHVERTREGFPFVAYTREKGEGTRPGGESA